MKRIIYCLLCNKLSGTIINLLFHRRVPNLRVGGFRFIIPGTTSPTITSSVFFGFYESAETRLIRKYLRKDLPVIELGGSIGIVSSIIASKLRPKGKLIIVEANSRLIPIINRNIQSNRKSDIAFDIINKAVAYDGSSVFLKISNNNTSSHLVKESENGLEVGTIRLSDIIKTNSVNDYTLVCDIEGSELDIIINDSEALIGCQQIFMELHSVISKDRSYSTEQLLQLLLEKNFCLVARDGNVVHLER